jgi:diguanylate cyclase (GGDEF)-like protein
VFDHVNGTLAGPAAKSAEGHDGHSWGTGIEGPLRVLVIEPDDARRRALAGNLRECGLPVKLREARGFVLGLAALRVDRFDCVLLARRLPDGDSLSFLSLLRNTEASATPLVFVLDDEDEAFESTALEAGAEDTILREDCFERTLRRTLRGAVARSGLKSELSRANARLERIAVNEPLTGLLNRRGLELALQREQALGLRKGVDNHLLLVNLDNFKSVNEGYGYDVGDRMLQEVARALEQTVRRTDHVSRIGGDEFLVLMPDSKLSAGLRTAERIRHRLEGIKVRTAAGSLTVLASLGVSRVPADARSVGDLVAEVGGAVRRSKLGGKNQVSMDSGQHSRSTGRILTIEDDVDVSLATPVFLAQPIIDLDDGELLAHWVLAPRSPALSEGLDVVSTLPELDAIKVDGDRRQLEGAVGAARGWSEDGAYFFFSAHPATLLHTPMSRLKAMFGGPDDPAAGSIMIGDHLILGDPSALIEPVKRLRDAGIGLGLRQVGFSRDSLEAVVLLRPRLVTLRIAHLLGPRRDKQRIGMIKRLVRTLEGLVPDIVLEGVVSEADRDLAVDLGVRYGVGSGVGGVFVLTAD